VSNGQPERAGHTGAGHTGAGHTGAGHTEKIGDRERPRGSEATTSEGGGPGASRRAGPARIGTTLRGEGTLPFLRPGSSPERLNPIERAKLARHPFEAVSELAARASAGPAALAAIPGEIERLKWAGLYPQRQGGDAFMLRIKVPGGRLAAEQARVIGEIASEFARPPGASDREPGPSVADLTTRQDVQLHWVHLADVPAVWQRLDQVGLTTIQACGDSARNVLCCPVAGVDPDEVFDATPIAAAISRFFTGERLYANLPRKFKMSVTGCREDCVRAEINDIGLWPATSEDVLGFNLLVGGGLSDGERMASDVDVFVEPSDAVEICRAIAQLYGELGNREHRGQARLRYLVQELGPEGFRHELAARTTLPLRPAGEALTTRYRGDHVGVHPERRPGFVSVGCCVPVGRLIGADLVAFAEVAEAFGDGTLRIGCDQNLILTGVATEQLEEVLGLEVLTRYSPFPGPFTRGVLACTGNEFCRFAVVESKQRAREVARALDDLFGASLGANGAGTDSSQPAEIQPAEIQPAEIQPAEIRPAGARVSGTRTPGAVVPPPSDVGPIRIHVSGCSASCGQPQIADIGLRGAAAVRGDALEEGFDIGLGGSLGQRAAFVDWIAASLQARGLLPSLTRLLGRFATTHRPEETFSEWVRRRSPEELRATLSPPTPADSITADSMSADSMPSHSGPVSRGRIDSGKSEAGPGEDAGRPLPADGPQPASARDADTRAPSSSGGPSAGDPPARTSPPARRASGGGSR